MSSTQSVTHILRERVCLEVESIDRLYLNVYVPKLQRVLGVVGFFREHHGATFASSALMEPLTTAFVKALERFAQTEGVPLLTFTHGQRKDEVAHEYLATFQGEEGVLFIGKAQEKAVVWRTERRRNAQTGQPYAWLVKSTALVNQYYIYAVDRDFGPFFLKFCSYFPYNAKLCLNGHEYLKRQLDREGITYETLDNGLLSCADPVRMQELCDGLDAPKIDGLLRKWLARLPHPFTPEEREAGFRYDVSILQAEFALTQVLDRPQTGRILFEEIIRFEPGPGPPRPGAPHLRPPHHQANERALPFPHPRDHARRGALTLRGLQAQPDQAIPQGGTRPADRNDHQRYTGLRHRQAAAQSARATGCRLCGQPTSPRRPTTQPRLPHRRGCLPPGDTPPEGRRPTRRRAALR